MAMKRLARVLALFSAGSLALTGCAPQLATLQAGHPDDRIYVDNQYAGTGITELRAGGYGPDRSFRIRIERPSLETYEATISNKVEPAMYGLSALTAALGVWFAVDAFRSPKDSLAANLNTWLAGIEFGMSWLSFTHRFKFDDAYRVTGQAQVVRPVAEMEPPAEVAGDKAIADTVLAAHVIRRESLHLPSYTQLEVAAIDALGKLAPSRADFESALAPLDEKRPFTALVSAVRLLSGRHSPQELNRTAIEAMLRAIDDPFAEYLVPASASASLVRFAANLGYREGSFSVLRVFKGTNAEKAGLKAGDRIVSVNGKAVQGLSFAAVNALLEGAEGSALELEVQRKGPKPLRLAMRREKPTFNGGEIDELANGIGYVRVNRLGPDIAKATGEAVERYADREGVVLDLRGANGGSPWDAAKVMSCFVKKGVAARMAGREALSLPAAGDMALPEQVRLVVLVDGGTSGGAEAIAGSLQDAKRAMLVGATTFGSARLQYYYPLGTTSYLKLSHAEQLTAGGRRIHGEGIRPDIVVPAGVDAAGRDWQLLAAVDYLVSGLSAEEIARKYKE